MGFSLKTTIEEISPNEVHAKFIAALLRVSSHENINSSSSSSKSDCTEGGFLKIV